MLPSRRSARAEASTSSTSEPSSRSTSSCRPPGPLGVGQLERRRFLDGLAPGRLVPVLGPEDIVLQKLRWYTLGGEVSDRHWRDIVSVLRTVGAELDDAYLDAVAGPAGLGRLLERARRGAKIGRRARHRMWS